MYIHICIDQYLPIIGLLFTVELSPRTVVDCKIVSAKLINGTNNINIIKCRYL